MTMFKAVPLDRIFDNLEKIKIMCVEIVKKEKKKKKKEEETIVTV